MHTHAQSKMFLQRVAVTSLHRKALGSHCHHFETCWMIINPYLKNMDLLGHNAWNSKHIFSHLGVWMVIYHGTIRKKITDYRSKKMVSSQKSTTMNTLLACLEDHPT